MNPPSNVALIHDWLTSWGGAERVLEAVLEIYPQAEIFTLVYEPNLYENSIIARAPVTTSFIDRLPWAKTRWRTYLPLMPLAVEQFDLRGYDVVISLSNAVAHGVLSQPDQLHVNYIYTPMRYAWRLYHQYLETAGLDRGLRGALAKVILHYLRSWDYVASARVDQFVAISNWVAQGVQRAYRRSAQVIYPPVDVERFDPGRPRGEEYLTVSRLVPYKKIDLLVDAFAGIDRPLTIVGDGPELDRLRERAPANVKLIGWQPESAVTESFETARAFVHAAEEDFGITLLEAQAAGCPVIAYGRGGARETVIAGQTGLFFDEQTVDALQQAVLEFERVEEAFDPVALRQQASRFSTERFQTAFAEMVAQAWRAFHKEGQHG